MRRMLRYLWSPAVAIGLGLAVSAGAVGTALAIDDHCPREHGYGLDAYGHCSLTGPESNPYKRSVIPNTPGNEHQEYAPVPQRATTTTVASLYNPPTYMRTPR